ncbi:MAG: hypothetical protein KIT09_00005 [Bryobacteraceae bacterium]|nr:hypothetical protein [Bryobacteraceae bacterium]
MIDSRVLLAAGAASLLLPFAGPSPAEIPIRVHISNLAGAPLPILEKARKEAARVFESAGVPMEFCDRSPTQEFIFDPHKTPTDVFLRLLPESLSSKFCKRGSVLGFAQPVGERQFRYVASIFYRRVWTAAKEAGLNPGVILGHVMAHELGHLLLGPDAHSSRGMMRCPWHADELTAAVQGRLIFRPEEVERMQEQVAARVAAAHGRRAPFPAANAQLPAGGTSRSLFHGAR